MYYITFSIVWAVWTLWATCSVQHNSFSIKAVFYRLCYCVCPSVMTIIAWYNDISQSYLRASKQINEDLEILGKRCTFNPNLAIKVWIKLVLSSLPTYWNSYYLILPILSPATQNHFHINRLTFTGLFLDFHSSTEYQRCRKLGLSASNANQERWDC